MHSPKVTGYDFQAKSEYRAELWKWVNDHMFAVPVNKRKVCYLDTKQCLETEYLLSLGYRANNLHPCNINPAEVALLTMRLDALGLPRVNTHGMDIARIVRQFGPFDVVSFDGCGHIGSPATLKAIRLISREMRPKSIITATILAGRETGDTADELNRSKIADGVRNAHDLRLKWLRHVIFTDRKGGECFRRW